MWGNNHLKAILNFISGTIQGYTLRMKNLKCITISRGCILKKFIGFSLSHTIKVSMFFSGCFGPLFSENFGTGKHQGGS